MAKNKKKTGLAIWTLLISLCLHAVLLAVFAFLKVSGCSSDNQAAAKPLVELQTVKKIIDMPKILPVPKIKSRAAAAETKTPLSVSPAGTTEKQEEATKTDSVKSLAQPVSDMPIAVGEQSLTEFFGSKTQLKNICYVVDCSGSMQGIFSKVKENLKNSINSLEPDQFFYIIFFGGDKLYEFDKAAMTRAYAASKNQAFSFIDSITPAGQTDAAAAIERAFKIKDSLGNGSDIIFLLTDGFDLAEGAGSYYFEENIKKQRKKSCPQTRINTIGFWTKPADCVILKDIAEDSHGSFTLIAEPKTERYIDIE